jgi:uncharacterized membrane protein
MTAHPFVVMANQYRTEEDALGDYESVLRLYNTLGIVDKFDGAVLTHGEDGAITIIRRTEEARRQGAAVGMVAGLALGLVAALFPAVGIAAGIIGGTTIGAGAGVLTGHMTGGLDPSDLADIGKLLDSGASGLVVVVSAELEAEVDHAIVLPERRMKVTLPDGNDPLKNAADTLRE